MKRKAIASLVFFLSLFVVSASNAQAQETSSDRFHIRLQLPFTSFILPQPGDNNSPTGVHSLVAFGFEATSFLELEVSLPIPIPIMGMNANAVVRGKLSMGAFQPFLYAGGGYFKAIGLENRPSWSGPTLLSGAGFRWKPTKHFALIFQGGLTTLFGSHQGSSSVPNNQTKFLPSFDALGLEFSF